MGFFQPDFTPSRDDSRPWSGKFVSFGGVKQSKRLRESRPIETPPDTDPRFDDTFRLREAGMEVPHGEDSPSFRRGVPTNNTTSSKNYKLDHVRIINGEHQTLLSVGEINEADENDDDDVHLANHRMELANPKLNEGQRRALLGHIKSHAKNKGKKLKAVAEGKAGPNPAINRMGPGPFKRGLGVMSRAKPAVQDDKIPQDSMFDQERKRTAGVVSMESKMRNFDTAVRGAYRKGY